MSQNFNDDAPDETRNAYNDLDAIRNNFAALKSCFSGNSAPANPVAGMWWYDTTAHILKVRNEANNAWLSVWNLASNKPVITNLSNEITGAMISSDIKDAAAGTASLRTLGTGAQQACAGNDARLSGVPDGSITPIKLATTAGVYQTLAALAEGNSSSTSYEKKKEIKLGRGGTYRISFALKPSNDGYAYGRIYRNGVGVGIERSNNYPTRWTTYTEDISGWLSGDLCQLYVRTSSAGCSVSAKDFTLSEDIPITGIVLMD